MFKILFRFIISLLLISALAYGGYYLYKKNKVKVDAFFKNSYEKVETFIKDKVKKDNEEENTENNEEEKTCEHHFVNALVSESTCISQGREVIQCDKCNLRKSTIITPKKNHNYEDWEMKVKPTFTTLGSRSHKCSYCGYEEVEDICSEIYLVGNWHYSMSDSDYLIEISKDKLNIYYCFLNDEKKLEKFSLVEEYLIINMGYDKEVKSYLLLKNNTSLLESYYYFNFDKENNYFTFDLENRSFIANKLDYEIIKHNHLYNEEKLEPTCENLGYIINTCNCGDIKKEEIPALGHNYEDEIVEATCESDGYKSKICNVCGYRLTYNAIDHNHSLKDYNIDSNNNISFVCYRCNKEKDNVVINQNVLVNPLILERTLEIPLDGNGNPDTNVICSLTFMDKLYNDIKNTKNKISFDIEFNYFANNEIKTFTKTIKKTAFGYISNFTLDGIKFIVNFDSSRQYGCLYIKSTAVKDTLYLMNATIKNIKYIPAT